MISNILTTVDIVIVVVPSLVSNQSQSTVLHVVSRTWVIGVSGCELDKRILVHLLNLPFLISPKTKHSVCLCELV